VRFFFLDHLSSWHIQTLLVAIRVFGSVRILEGWCLAVPTSPVVLGGQALAGHCCPTPTAHTHAHTCSLLFPALTHAPPPTALPPALAPYLPTHHTTPAYTHTPPTPHTTPPAAAPQPLRLPLKPSWHAGAAPQRDSLTCLAISSTAYRLPADGRRTTYHIPARHAGKRNETLNADDVTCSTLRTAPARSIAPLRAASTPGQSDEQRA